MDLYPKTINKKKTIELNTWKFKLPYGKIIINDLKIEAGQTIYNLHNWQHIKINTSITKTQVDKQVKEMRMQFTDVNDKLGENYFCNAHNW